MTTIQHRIFSIVMFSLLVWIITVSTSLASETAFFEQKDEGFWVLKNKTAFIKAAEQLIDNDGNWKGNPPIPQYIKFSEELTTDDLPTLKKWLSLKGLYCFAIADRLEQPNLNLIHSWYSELRDKGTNLDDVHFEKLAWLNFRSTLTQLGRGEASILPANNIETNRAFQMVNSHYYSIETH